MNDPAATLAEDVPVLREDLEGKTSGVHGARRHHNHIFTWEVGDREATERAFAEAEITVEEKVVYQRVHPCPLETCACIASMDKIKGEVTVWGTFQPPHVVWTVASLLSGIPEAKIHIIAPDIGGGFGNKVGDYPGYCVLGVPVKWVEDRTENLSATAFARDYHMTGALAATRDGRITGPSGLAHGDGLARSRGRRAHGWPVPQLGGPDHPPGARRAADCFGKARGSTCPPLDLNTAGPARVVDLPSPLRHGCHERITA